jgi:ATP-dependent Clp protease protease subunit
VHDPPALHVRARPARPADIDIYAREILRMREILNGILADATGQDVERIARDVDRDYIMEAEQAVAYGMVDKIISKRER